MTKEKPLNQNNIWHKFFIRSANAFAFDLKDQEIDLKQFSIEELYSLAAVCDDIAVRGLVFKKELEKRIKN